MHKILNFKKIYYLPQNKFTIYLNFCQIYYFLKIFFWKKQFFVLLSDINFIVFFLSFYLIKSFIKLHLK